jgi:hypothetical protein
MLLIYLERSKIKVSIDKSRWIVVDIIYHIPGESVCKRDARYTGTHRYRYPDNHLD